MDSRPRRPSETALRPRTLAIQQLLRRSLPPFHHAPGLYPGDVQRLFDSPQTGQMCPSVATLLHCCWQFSDNRSSAFGWMRQRLQQQLWASVNSVGSIDFAGMVVDGVLTDPQFFGHLFLEESFQE